MAPDTVKPAPLSAAELMVTGAVPVEVNVTGCVEAVFTVTSPNVRLAVLIRQLRTRHCRARAAQINNRCAVGRRIALDGQLTRRRSRAVGSNCTFSVTDWLGFKVTGNVAPDIVKPVPLSAAELMVTGAVPVEVNVTGCVDAVFTVTSPNVRLAALTVNCGLDPPCPCRSN